MSLHPQPIEPVPAQTASVAQAAFPKGNLYVRLRDTLGSIYQDPLFADLFAIRGQSALTPWRLALVSIFQFLEDLSDRQAAEAVRSRIDWKYALGLELTDPGFDASILVEFRGRLLAHQAEERLLDRLIELFIEQGYLKKRGVQRSDSTHILAAVRRLNRLELLGESVRAALNVVAELEPEWLKQWVPVAWFERYSCRIEEWRLPAAQDGQKNLAEQIGEDGSELLRQVYGPKAPQELRNLTEIEQLRIIWLQQFEWQDEQLRLRKKDNLPPAHLTLRSPYDSEAQFATKREMTWYGYKVHLSESCEEDQVHLITNVLTTPATKTDVEETAELHQKWAERDLLPDKHIVDAGYVDAELVVQSCQKYGIKLVGPVSHNNQWQARAGQGYDLASFKIDWSRREAICPEGKHSVKWTEGTDQHGHGNISIRFGLHDCLGCAVRSKCTKSKHWPRTLALRGQAEHEALETARLKQQSEEFKKDYARRAGVEGTISQGVRGYGLRRSRYLGLKKTHLQNILTAGAMNLVRLDAYLRGKQAAKTRVSRFAALAPALALAG